MCGLVVTQQVEVERFGFPRYNVCIVNIIVVQLCIVDRYRHDMPSVKVTIRDFCNIFLEQQVYLSARLVIGNYQLAAFLNNNSAIGEIDTFCVCGVTFRNHNRPFNHHIIVRCRDSRITFVPPFLVKPSTWIFPVVWDQSELACRRVYFCLIFIV